MLNHSPSETNLNIIARSQCLNGQYSKSKDTLREILLENPGDVNALNTLALLATRTKQHTTAMKILTKIIEADCCNFEAYNERGKLHRKIGNLNIAINDFTIALTIRPNSFEPIVSRGISFAEGLQFNEALKDFSQAIQIEPLSSEAHYNRALAYKQLQQFSLAIDDYSLAIKLNPDNFRAYNNRAMVFRELKDFNNAISDFDKCLFLKPNFPEAMWNKSLTLMLTGDYKNGWPLFESRWLTPDFIGQKRDFEVPLWLGQYSLDGKAILIHSEQGLGDTIQFSRYLSLFDQMQCNVFLEIENSLASIMKTLITSDKIFLKGKPLPEFDYHCPMMSLPLAFQTIGIEVPKKVKYLTPPEKEVKIWSKLLNKNSKPRVGIAWRGNPKHVKDKNRSIELEKIIQKLSAKFEWVCLHNNPTDKENKLMAENGHFLNFGVEIGDFAKTGALCSHLDAVVSVDTSIAHLAGAIGMPIHLMLPFLPDFRWHHEGNYSQWYPTMKIHRQNNTRSWETVIESVNFELSSLYR